MANIILTFSNPVNISLQPGDRVYAVMPNPIGGFYSADLVGSSDVIYLGVCAGLSNQFTQNLPGNQTIAWNIGVTQNPNPLQANQVYLDPANPQFATPNEIPDTHTHIIFSKDNRANLGDVRGYYAEVTLKNDSTKKAELFSIGMEVVESSK